MSFCSGNLHSYLISPSCLLRAQCQWKEMKGRVANTVVTIVLLPIKFNCHPPQVPPRELTRAQSPTIVSSMYRAETLWALRFLRMLAFAKVQPRLVDPVSGQTRSSASRRHFTSSKASHLLSPLLLLHSDTQGLGP